MARAGCRGQTFNSRRSRHGAGDRHPFRGARGWKTGTDIWLGGLERRGQAFKADMIPFEMGSLSLSFWNRGTGIWLGLVAGDRHSIPIGKRGQTSGSGGEKRGQAFNADPIPEEALMEDEFSPHSSGGWQSVCGFNPV